MGWVEGRVCCGDRDDGDGSEGETRKASLEDGRDQSENLVADGMNWSQNVLYSGLCR